MNILLVMADQLTPFMTGPYGDPVAKTPHLDRLAAEGVRFDAAYSPYPLCAPARAAFMTGTYASTFGCYDNAALFPADRPTLAHYLTNAGYECVLSGKMHFVGPDQLHGFRRRLTTDVFPAGFDWVPLQDEEGGFVRGDHAQSYVLPNVGPTGWTKFLAFDEETHFRALEYLRAGGDGPFFLVVSYHHPHDPFLVTQELWDLYEDAEIPIAQRAADLDYTAMDRWANEAHGTDGVDLDDPDNLRALRRAYYGLVTYVDRKVGELVDAVGDDTLVVFASDHGDMLGERRMVQKRCFYEWSARIPLIIRFPDGRDAGLTVADPVSLLDLVPTLAGAVEETDGADLFEGGRTILSEYHVEKVRAPCFMARAGRYKYIYVHGHDSRLFDLEADPAELSPIEDAAVEEELRARILERFDPDRIAADGEASVRRREVIRRAMERNGTRWDHTPVFEGREQYVR